MVEDDALQLARGGHTLVLPPFKLSVCRVILSVADAVAAKDPVCEIRPWRLTKRNQSVSNYFSLSRDKKKQQCSLL